MSGYIGTQPVPQATQTRDSFTATSGQTSFATGGYTPNFLDVYLNGVKLASADYTATNGSDVVLASGAATGDILEVVAFTTFNSASSSIDDNADAVALTIDSSENVLIGKTATGGNVAGMQIINGSFFSHVRDGGVVQVLNRKSSDGDILSFEKDNTAVGSIGVTSNRLTIGGGDTGLRFVQDYDEITPWNPSTNGVRDGAIDLGSSANRFKDAYLSGGVYLGGTGSANKLDDYEEGTFSAALTATSSGTITLNSSYDTFFYTKVGNLVHISGYIRISSVSSPTGVIRFTLPFTVASLGDSSSAVLVYANNLASGSVTDMWAECSDNNPYVYIYAGGGTGVTGTSAQQTQAATDFRISGTYKTSQ